MEKGEFFCPIYNGMIEQYDCDEISYSAETGRYINDGLSFLVPIEKVVNQKELCLKCEHNASNTVREKSPKKLIAAIEGKDLNKDSIHELAKLMQQAVLENQNQ